MQKRCFKINGVCLILTLLENLIVHQTLHHLWKATLTYKPTLLQFFSETEELQSFWSKVGCNCNSLCWIRDSCTKDLVEYSTLDK